MKEWEVKEFQILAFNWLIRRHDTGFNAFLADEMRAWEDGGGDFAAGRLESTSCGCSAQEHVAQLGV